MVDPVTRQPARDREVGELEIRGTSVTTGLLPAPRRHRRRCSTTAGSAPATSPTSLDGELVVCGRIKDVIIVGGRNVFPEDVERAVAAVEGVRAGNVIAFGVDRQGKEALVVVAEASWASRPTAADSDGVRRQVADRVRSSVGLPAKDVVLVAPGTLPKTASGKLQRSLCRQRYLTTGRRLTDPSRSERSAEPAMPRTGSTGQADLRASITGSQVSGSVWYGA